MELEQVWYTFRDPLKTFILRRIHQPHEVEDILQDVFLKIYTKLDDLRDEQKLRPWIYQIARHSVIDFYRKDKSFEQLPDEWSESDTPDEDNANRELAECLRPMIRQLPEKYRQAIELAEFEGLSQKELSEQLGLSFSGAKSRVQRGRQKLKELLFDCCHLELDRYGNVLEYAARKPASHCDSCDCS